MHIMLMVLIIIIVLFARGHSFVTVLGLGWIEPSKQTENCTSEIFVFSLASVPSNKDPQQRRQSKVSGKLSFLER